MPIGPKPGASFPANMTRAMVLAELRKILLIGVVLGVIALFLSLIRLGQPLNLFLYGVLLPLFLYASYRASRYQAESMRRFADACGFEYASYSDLDDSYASMLFKKGHSRAIANVVSGEYGATAFELFHFQYTTGSGKNSQSHFYTVCCFDFSGPLPDLILEENRFFEGEALADTYHKSLTLDAGFAKRFNLYVAEDLEIEALEILTPEVMEFLIDRGSAYSIEMRDKRMYVIENGTLFQSKDLVPFVVFGSELVDRIGPRLSRLHDDVERIHEVHAEAE